MVEKSSLDYTKLPITPQKTWSQHQVDSLIFLWILRFVCVLLNPYKTCSPQSDTCKTYQLRLEILGLQIYLIDAEFYFYIGAKYYSKSLVSIIWTSDCVQN